jgi:hypothetical protein
MAKVDDGDEIFANLRAFAANADVLADLGRGAGRELIVHKYAY